MKNVKHLILLYITSHRLSTKSFRRSDQILHFIFTQAHILFSSETRTKRLLHFHVLPLGEGSGAVVNGGPGARRPGQGQGGCLGREE